MNTHFRLDNARDTAIYIRQSSYGQPMQSLDVQTGECRRCADANRLYVVSVYTDTLDNPFTSNRSALRRLLADAAAGLFRYVVVLRDTYLASHSYDLALCLSQLEQYRVRVLYAVPLPPLDGPRLVLQACLRETSALYAERLAAEIRRSLPSAPVAERIATDGVPLGYALDGQALVPGENAFLIRDMFAAYASGASFAETEAMYMQFNWPSYIDISNISLDVPALLRDEVYTGVLPFELIHIEDACPALVNKDLFARVQNRLAADRTPIEDTAPHFFASHKLLCDKCTAPMRGVYHTLANGEEAYSYACTNHIDDEECHKVIEDKDALEINIVECAMSILLAPHNIDIVANQIIDLYNKEYSNEALAAREQAITNLLAQSTALQTPFFSDERREEMSPLLDIAKTGVPDAQLGHCRMRVAQTIPCTHDMVRAWLHKLSDCRSENPVFRHYFFDNFVRAAWVNDQRILVALNLQLPGRADGIAYLSSREPSK